jgi:hypothetical protein
MKLIYPLAALAALAASSCADMKLGTFSLVTPHGTISADKEGRISGTITVAESGK